MESINVIIDRFEGDYAVVETDNNGFINLPLTLIPHGAAEGSVLTISVNTSETERRSRKINSMLDKLIGRK